MVFDRLTWPRRTPHITSEQAKQNVANKRNRARNGPQGMSSLSTRRAAVKPKEVDGASMSSLASRYIQFFCMATNPTMSHGVQRDTIHEAIFGVMENRCSLHLNTSLWNPKMPETYSRF